MARDIVRESVQKWRDELINLARSNRLIYFRHTKTSTLEIEDPTHGEILKRLGEPGKSGWFFYFPPEPPEEGHEAQPLQPRGWKELLTTKSEPKVLANALRNLDRRATQEFMDKGLWILYLGIGMLEWLDPSDEETADSPLLLVPVMLHRNSPRDPYMLHRADEDPVINPALHAKLANEFGIELPTIEDVEELDPERILSIVRERVAGRSDWRVTHRVILGCFSFYKEVMYRDLIQNEEAICSHEMVKALALGPKAEAELDFDPVPEERLDDLEPPEESVAILDADASQRQCIAAAKAGHSFVMDGPPGTGKSQTISNIIAELLVRGKTILFVSEKAAALDVVHKRLAAAGLSEYLLELHSHKATRKEVAQELGRALTAHPRPRPGLSTTDFSRLIARRKELSGYARALNEVRQPLGRSLHEVIGRISDLQKLPQAPVASFLTVDVKPDELAELMETALALARAWGPVAREETFHWREVAELDATAARRKDLTDQADEALRSVEGLDPASSAAAYETGLAWKASFANAQRLVEVLEHLEDRVQIPSTWLTRPDFDPVVRRAEELAVLNAKQASSAEKLTRIIGEGWRKVDPSAEQRIGDALHNLAQGQFALSLSPTWRAGDLQSLVRFFERSLQMLPPLIDKAHALAEAFGVRAKGVSPNRILQISQLGLAIGSPNLPEPAWLNPALLGSIEEASRVLGSLVFQYRDKQTLLSEVFKDSVLNLDLEGLTVRFESVHRGLGKLRSSYRADRKAIRFCSRSGKANKKVLSNLRTALEWQRVATELRLAEQIHAEVLGSHYFRGIQTDFGAVTGAIEMARNALNVVGDQLKPGLLARQIGRGATPDPELVPLAREFAGVISSWKREAELLPGDQLDSLPESSLSDLIPWFSEAAISIRPVAEAVQDVNLVANADFEFQLAVEVLNERAVVNQVEMEVVSSLPDDAAILGSFYTGLETDWDELRRALRWALKLRSLCEAPLNSRTAQRLMSSEHPSHVLQTSLKHWRKVEEQLLSNFLSQRRVQLEAELSTTFEEAKELLSEMRVSVDDFSEWIEFARHRDSLAEAGLEAAVTFCTARRLPPEQVAPVLERSLLERWVDGIMKTDPRLRTFRAGDRDQYVEEFRSLDRALVNSAVGRVIEACNERRPRTSAGMAGIIAHEANKKRRHMPIRTLLDRTAPVAQALKPCFMMSPLSVSQFLPQSARFDVVIFDEASQVRPSDAVNCIYRAKQLIVAGDQKQLPPTAFFERVWLDEGDEYVEDQLEEFDSVLDLAKGSGGLKSLSLRWHYRSQHESLITFSNYSFYEGRLITFPSSTELSTDMGIEFFKADGIYRRGGPRDNPIEAIKVAERVLFHARRHPHLSLGVVAFSEAQATAIELELERQRLKQPELDSFFTDDRLTGFVVKNLENVQGDERDIIIFSIGYGPDEVGKFTLQFGPINQAGGQKRLNVAVTRARRRVEVVSSVTAADFYGELPREGVRHLKRYLDYAERGLPALALEITPAGGDVESPFEASVASLIRSWGFDVVPQVGVADYRIDLAVRDPSRPGRFAIGIECDGVMYHSSKVARDRDRLRHEVLERLGWRLYRIWGTAWYADRANQETRLKRAIEESFTSGLSPYSGQEETVRLADSEAELQQIDLDEAPAWAVPYQVAEISSRDRHWLELHDPSAQPELKRLIGRVIDVEGPVAEEVVLRRIRDAWGLGRAGARVREAFDHALRALVTSGKAKRDPQGFVWLSGQDLTGVRVAVEGRPETRRDVAEVPLAEIEMAVRLLVSDARSISWQELSTSVARLFGWARKGPDIAEALDVAIDELVSQGALKKDRDSLEPTETTAP